MNLLNARSHQAAREPNLLFASMKKKKSISRELVSEHFADGNENCLSTTFFFFSNLWLYQDGL